MSVIGDALLPVALAFAVLDELHGTPGQLGLVLAAETLPLALLILAAGVWADRLNRRSVMVVSDLGRAAVQATLATLLLTDVAHLWHVVALAAVYGVFDAFFQPTAGGLVPQVAGREHHFWRDLKGGIAEVARRRWMWTFMPGFSAYHRLALPCVLALGPVIADRELNGASSWATITACFGIGTIVGSVVALRIRARHPMYGATLAFIGASCQALIIAYGDSTAAIAALMIVAGVAVSYGFTLWDTSLGREIPPHALSRVTSLDWFTTTGLMPIGFAVVAPAAELIGTTCAASPHLDRAAQR